MDSHHHAKKIVQHLLSNDPFSQWLGIEVLDVSPGRVTLRMTVRREMLNGFGVGHGGVTFAFADSALAFASNSHGRLSLALAANISYPAKVMEGDVLTATAVEESLSEKVGVYSISVRNQEEAVVALFQGTVYRTSKEHSVEREKDAGA